MKKQKNIQANIPDHIAIIMDGNGTWAKRRGLPRNYGHRSGANRLIELVYYANELGLKYLTVFAFSTENWSRPKEEVDFLLKLPFEFIEENKEKLISSNIKVELIGRRDRIDEKLREQIYSIEEDTKLNTGLTFIIAFDYGSQDEILRAINKILEEDIKEIDKQTFEGYLDTKNYPNIDLLIRTSGQKRISNFLLWQIAYSEIYITKTLWPAFGKKAFNKALKDYKKRERRYGGLK